MDLLNCASRGTSGSVGSGFLATLLPGGPPQLLLEDVEVAGSILAFAGLKSLSHLPVSPCDLAPRPFVPEHNGSYGRHACLGTIALVPDDACSFTLTSIEESSIRSKGNPELADSFAILTPTSTAYEGQSTARPLHAFGLTILRGFLCKS